MLLVWLDVIINVTIEITSINLKLLMEANPINRFNVKYENLGKNSKIRTINISFPNIAMVRS